MKKIWIGSLVILLMQQVPAQVMDNTNGWLYQLGKTWGYVKYFNQNKCGVPWTERLNTTINEILAAKNNNEFNVAIYRFLDLAGNNNPVANPPALPDTNLLVDTNWIDDPVFNSPVRNFLKQFRSNIHPDASTCLVSIDYLGGNYLNFRGDPINLTADFTNESHRLTIFFYYWNVINYFFPYRNLMDQPWDSTLREFIPLLRKPMTETEFHKEFLKLATKINDSHGYTHSSKLNEYFWKGSYLPRIVFERIEDQCVVRKVSVNGGMVPGDILTAMDGIEIKTIEDSLARFIHSSTPAALYRNLYKHMIRGGQNSPIVLTLTNKQGQSNTITINRDTDLYTWEDWEKGNGMQGSYRITACGYGYVDMGKLTVNEVPAMYSALKSAPAIIFDLRNYPNGTLRSLIPLFFNSPITSAVIYYPALNSTQQINNKQYLPGWYIKRDDSGFGGFWNNTSPYSGKVYILVNQVTQSQAEQICQYLSYHPNAKVIGTQTAGADGTKVILGLPGELYTGFTSLGWYYADGYQQQRNGVKIDRVVAPTIQGIRDGEDEILMAALDCLSGTGKKVSNPFAVTVYPNPATSGTATVSLNLSENSEITLSLIDLTGKTNLRENRSLSAGEQTIRLDLQKVAPGFYLLKTETVQGSTVVKLEIR